MPDPCKTVLPIDDATARRMLQDALTERTSELERANQALVETQSVARVGSWEMDLATSGLDTSAEMRRLLGFSPDLQPTYEEMSARMHPDDREYVVHAHRVAMADLDPFVVEHRVLLADGAVRWVRSRGRVELDEHGHAARIFGTAEDVTEQKDAEHALQHHALHEPLTGLPNRLLLVDRLGHTLNRLARAPATVAVIHLDLDRFTLINESLGHAAGDQVLLVVSARLQSHLRPDDTLAHIGGDEFVVLCETVSGESEAVRIADRLRAAVAEPLDQVGGDLVVTASAGVSLTTSATSSADALLRDADAAVNKAKRAGRDRTAVFVQTMLVGSRLQTETELRQAIAGDELCVHYQPIVSLADGAVLGHEALVRWNHPTRGLVGPDQFIAIAEETGLIVPLGMWVLREACRQARRFQELDARWSHLTMSVNLSGGQLGQRDLVELVAGALDDAGIRPEDLQLEMTESVLMNDASGAITVLEQLKGLGIRLGVDDFGTGYSSLAYLRRFSVDVLKIDQSFVRGVGDELEDEAIVAAIVGLAASLELTAIAEGVETEQQRDALRALGCPRAQGYFFAFPAAAPDVEAALRLAVDGVMQPPATAGVP
jgi:diguanylate cyclase (GGDEF)-like protein/PAS domain S-box-containing protein